jgi:alpha-glucosidase
MQWTPGLNAGFSPPGVETWLPVHANHAQGVNVAQQEADTGSLLSFYRRLVAVRRTNPALVAGEYISLGRVDEADECLAYLRRVSEQTCLVVLNMSGQSLELDLVERLGAALAGTELSGGPAARLLFSSRERAVGSQDPAKLGIGPFEVCILDLG